MVTFNPPNSLGRAFVNFSTSLVFVDSFPPFGLKKCNTQYWIRMQHVIPAIFRVFQARGDREADVKRKVAGTLCSMSATCSPEKRGEKIAPACRKIECFSLSRPWGKSHYTNRELTFSNLSFIPPQQIATVSAIPAKTPASNVSVFAAALSVFSLSSLEVGFSIQKGKMT